MVFDTGTEAASLEEFPDAVRNCSRESFFYHFIDGRRRSPECKDDFTLWLEQFPEESASLRKRLKNVDSYLFSLSELKAQVLSIIDDWKAGKGGMM